MRSCFHALFIVLVVLSIAACAAPAPAPTPSPGVVAQQPTQTAYPASTAYPTATPYPTFTAMPSPTSTPMPTATSTPTPTVTAKPVTQSVTLKSTVAPQAPAGSAALWHTPGRYPMQGQCVDYHETFGKRGWDVTFCITQVEVHEQVLRFYGDWHLKLVSGTFKSRSLWHPNSRYVTYVTDNLGNKYVHARMGGAADADTIVESPDYLLGYKDNDSPEFPHEPSAWWEFEPAKPGASSFTFHNDAFGFTIGPIVLSR